MSYGKWKKFFVKVGIPEDTAEVYAERFNMNGIPFNMENVIEKVTFSTINVMGMATF